jgi:hypothetical protein
MNLNAKIREKFHPKLIVIFFTSFQDAQVYFVRAIIYFLVLIVGIDNQTQLKQICI